MILVKVQHFCLNMRLFTWLEILPAEFSTQRLPEVYNPQTSVDTWHVLSGHLKLLSIKEITTIIEVMAVMLYGICSHIFEA